MTNTTRNGNFIYLTRSSSNSGNESMDRDNSGNTSFFSFENFTSYLALRDNMSHLSTCRKINKGADDDIKMDGNSDNSNSNSNNNDNDNSNDCDDSKNGKEKTALDEGYDNIENIFSLERLARGKVYYVHNLFDLCFDYVVSTKLERTTPPVIEDEDKWNRVCKKGKYSDDQETTVHVRSNIFYEMMSTVYIWQNEGLIKEWKNEMETHMNKSNFGEAQELLQVMLLTTEKMAIRLARSQTSKSPTERDWDPFVFLDSLCDCLKYYAREEFKGGRPDNFNCMLYVKYYIILYYIRQV